MGRNAPGTRGYSMSAAMRGRKPVNLTIVKAELDALKRVADARGVSRSQAAGQLFVEAAERLLGAQAALEEKK